ncbi:MAG: glycosyltransferase family 39 protein, partial [Planctomycetes bacterium]|nr:glycosyltransferase family 39 protein [Planctomycetota bacterium]
MSRHPGMRRAPWLLLVLAAAMRSFGCAVTPVPGRDGTAYLWMAEQWSDGDWHGLFATVFHPLYPVLVGAVSWCAPDLDIVLRGQIASALPATIAILPLWCVAARLFDERAAFWTCLAYAIGNWFVRHPADCMSEGPFYLLAIGWACLLLADRRRPALAGLTGGLAFLARPEGAVLIAIGAGHLLGNGARRAALSHFGVGVAVMALQPLGAFAAGRELLLTPKAGFNWSVGAGGADDPFVYYAEQWLRLPGDAWEGIGYLAFPLAIAGAIRFRPRRLADPRWCLLLPLAAQCAIVPLLKSHHRFVSGFAILLLPFAGAAIASTTSWLRGRHRAWPAIVLLLLIGSEAKLLVDWPADRTIERDLGRWLRTERSPPQIVASDMPRLVFFAGLPPPPPR